MPIDHAIILQSCVLLLSISYLVLLVQRLPSSLSASVAPSGFLCYSAGEFGFLASWLAGLRSFAVAAAGLFVWVAIVIYLVGYSKTE